MSKTTKETEATATTPKIDRTKLTQVKVSRKLNTDLNYVGVIYTQIPDYCNLIREEQPKTADWTDHAIL